MNKDSFWPFAGLCFLRFLLYHFMCLMVMLGLMAVLPGVWGALAAQALALILVTVLPFSNAYAVGDRDHNKVKFGRIRRDPLKGFKAAAVGYAPFLLAAVALPLARIGLLPAGYLPYYRILNTPFMALMQSLIPTALTFHEVSLGRVLLAALTSLILPAASGLGYWQGLDRIPLPFGGHKDQPSRE